MAIRPQATMEPITLVPSSRALSPEPQVKPLMLMEGMEPASWLVTPRATPLQPLTSSARSCQPYGYMPRWYLTAWHGDERLQHAQKQLLLLMMMKAQYAQWLLTLRVHPQHQVGKVLEL